MYLNVNVMYLNIQVNVMYLNYAANYIEKRKKKGSQSKIYKKNF